MDRCMHEASQNKDRPNDQNVAICLDAWRKGKSDEKALKLPVQFRRIDSGNIDQEKRTISLSFSSDTPVKRFFGYEVLSHDPKAINTKRLRSGAVPLLLNHDWNQQIGRVTDYEIRGGKAYATALISRSEQAVEILNDIEDGIRRNISVGYIPEALRKLKRDEAQELLDAMDDDDDDDDDDDKKDDDDDDDDGEEVDVFQLTRWMPIEVSIVSVPADVSVGIGRQSEEVYEVRILDSESEVKLTSEVVLEQEVRNMADAAQTVPELKSVEIVKEDFTKERELEFARMREIQKIGHEFGLNDAAAEYVRDGKSIADFQSHVLANIKPREPARLIEPNLGYHARDLNRYSIVRAIQKQIAVKQGTGKWDGIEAEMSAELARVHHEEPMGFYMPDFALTRDMQVGTPSLGGVTVQTTVDTNLIPLLRNRMVVLRAGARLMTGLVGNLSIPRQNAAATISWNTEIAALTESDQGFDSVLLSPNRVGGWTNYSKKLLAQSSLDIEGIIRDDLIAIIAIAQDNVALNGTGTNQPTGIFNITANTAPPYNYADTAPAITFPTGGVPTWTNVVSFEGNLETGNLVLDESAAYITSPGVKAAWKTYAKADPRATNQFYPAFYWEGTGGDAGEVNGYKAFATNQIVANKVCFGKWNECMIAQWAGLDIVVDIYTLAANAEVRVIANLFCDVKFRYCSAFCCSTNSGISN